VDSTPIELLPLKTRDPRRPMGVTAGSGDRTPSVNLVISASWQMASILLL